MSVMCDLECTIKHLYYGMLCHGRSDQILFGGAGYILGGGII